MKLKKGDEIQILRGKDKGKRGKVENLFPKENKVLVLGFNEYKRHLKANAQNKQSGIITITKPLPISNIAVICPKCNLRTRVGYIYENNKKRRICRKCDQQI